MWKAEWDCTDTMKKLQRIVDYYDKLYIHAIVERATRNVDEHSKVFSEMNRAACMERITSWVNLQEGLDP
jgi:hypothetical protein